MFYTPPQKLPQEESSYLWRAKYAPRLVAQITG